MGVSMNGNVVMYGVSVMNDRSGISAMNRHDGVFFLFLFFVTFYRLFGLSRCLLLFLGLFTLRLVMSFLGVASCPNSIGRTKVVKFMGAVVARRTIGTKVWVGAISAAKVSVGAISATEVSVGAIGVAVIPIGAIDIAHVTVGAPGAAVRSMRTIGMWAIVIAVVDFVLR